jgi:hypothetical protein
VKSEYHIVVRDGGWSVKNQDQGRIGATTYPMREEAVRAGREALRDAGGGELIIHGRDGRIRDRDTVFGS